MRSSFRGGAHCRSIEVVVMLLQAPSHEMTLVRCSRLNNESVRILDSGPVVIPFGTHPGGSLPCSKWGAIRGFWRHEAWALFHPATYMLKFIVSFLSNEPMYFLIRQVSSTQTPQPEWPESAVSWELGRWLSNDDEWALKMTVLNNKD